MELEGEDERDPLLGERMMICHSFPVEVSQLLIACHRSRWPICS